MHLRCIFRMSPNGTSCRRRAPQLAIIAMLELERPELRQLAKWRVVDTRVTYAC